MYDVLKSLYNQLQLNAEQRLWFTVLYLAYYDITSALSAFYAAGPYPAVPENAGRWPCAVERRGLRGGKVEIFLREYCNATGLDGQKPWITRGWGSDPAANYELFWEQAQTLWGNGRWAAFKWADLLKNVHELPLAAPDMRMAFCSGPKEGLEWLYGLSGASVAELDAAGADLMERLRAAGVPLEDWEQLETILCNFNSTRKGKYYVGHDIDEMQHVIESADIGPDAKRALWRARGDALPDHYLGERRGWHGVDPKRKHAYRDSGLIVVRSE